MHFSTILSVTFAALALAHPNKVIQRDAQNTPDLSARSPQFTAEASYAGPLSPNAVEERAPQITDEAELTNADDLAVRAPQGTVQNPQGTVQNPPMTIS